MSDEILTLREVASFLKVSVKTAYRLAQSGRLPGFKAGGSWRFRRRDIEAWVDERIRSSNDRGEGGQDDR